jgi:uncharacterized protein
LGGVEKLEEALRSQEVEGVIVTTGGLLSSAPGQQLLATCREQGVWVRVMRLEFEMAE